MVTVVSVARTVIIRHTKQYFLYWAPIFHMEQYYYSIGSCSDHMTAYSCCECTYTLHYHQSYNQVVFTIRHFRGGSFWELDSSHTSSQTANLKVSEWSCWDRWHNYNHELAVMSMNDSDFTTDRDISNSQTVLYQKDPIDWSTNESIG